MEAAAAVDMLRSQREHDLGVIVAPGGEAIADQVGEAFGLAGGVGHAGAPYNAKALARKGSGPVSLFRVIPAKAGEGRDPLIRRHAGDEVDPALAGLTIEWASMSQTLLR